MPAQSQKALENLTSQRALALSGVTNVPTVAGPTGPILPRAFKVDVAGAVNCRMVDDTAFVTSSYAAGVWHPCGFIQVDQTGTVATGLVFGY